LSETRRTGSRARFHGVGDLVHLPEWTFDRKRISASSNLNFNLKAQKCFWENEIDVIFWASFRISIRHFSIFIKIVFQTDGISNEPFEFYFSYYFNQKKKKKLVKGNASYLGGTAISPNLSYLLVGRLAISTAIPFNTHKKKR